MNKTLEELAKLVGRAWAREWLENPRNQPPATHQREESVRQAEDCTRQSPTAYLEQGNPKDNDSGP